MCKQPQIWNHTKGNFCLRMQVGLHVKANHGLYVTPPHCNPQLKNHTKIYPAQVYTNVSVLTPANQIPGCQNPSAGTCFCYLQRKPRATMLAEQASQATF